MAIKYQCPKCGRRFVDWGAEKLGFMCPDDEGVELVRVGAGDDASPSPRRSSAKKAPRRVAAVAAVEDEAIDEEEFEAPDAEESAEDEVEGEEEEVAVVEPGVDDAVAVDDEVEADPDEVAADDDEE